MAPPRPERRRRLFTFHAPEARRLAALFGVVYFAQGMWSLPNQTITISFKDLGLSAGQVCFLDALHVVFRSFRSRSCFTAS